MNLTDEQKQLKDDVAAIEARFQALKSAKSQQKEESLIASITEQAAALEHDLRSAAYIEYQESAAYVQNLKDSIRTAGTAATVVNTGKDIHVRLSADLKTLDTFSDLKAGQTIDCGGMSYFVTAFDFNFAGSKANLLPVTSKAYIGLPGTKQTPYNAIDCHYDRPTRRLTVPSRHAIKSNEIVTIGDKCFQPAFSLLSPPKGFVCYELREVQ